MLHSAVCLGLTWSFAGKFRREELGEAPAQRVIGTAFTWDVDPQPGEDGLDEAHPVLPLAITSLSPGSPAFH